jgi:hypothetical protein
VPLRNIELCHIYKGFINCFHAVILSCIVSTRHEYKLDFSVLIPRPPFLPVTNEASVFFFIQAVCTFNRIHSYQRKPEASVPQSIVIYLVYTNIPNGLF